MSIYFPVSNYASSLPCFKLRVIERFPGIFEVPKGPFITGAYAYNKTPDNTNIQGTGDVLVIVNVRNIGDIFI